MGLGRLEFVGEGESLSLLFFSRRLSAIIAASADRFCENYISSHLKGAYSSSGGEATSLARAGLFARDDGSRLLVGAVCNRADDAELNS